MHRVVEKMMHKEAPDLMKKFDNLKVGLNVMHDLGVDGLPTEEKKSQSI